MYRNTQPKRKNRPSQRALITGAGCGLALVMLLLGLVIGAGGMFFAAPYLFDADGTAAALDRQRTELAQTRSANLQIASDLQNAGTANALIVQATGAALDNDRALLQQTATQAARFISATGTARAVVNEQQMTQASLNYAATQSQLQREATQVELDFIATQNAIYGDATAVSNRTDDTLPDIAAAVQSPQVVLDTRFDRDRDLSAYVHDTGAWRSDAGALFAMQAISTLQTQDSFSNFGARITFTPNNAQTSRYVFRMGEAGSRPYLIILSGQDGRIHNAALTRDYNGDAISSQAVNVSGRVDLIIDARGSLTVTLGGQQIAALESAQISGPLGIELPAGALLHRVTVTAY